MVKMKTTIELDGLMTCNEDEVKLRSCRLTLRRQNAESSLLWKKNRPHPESQDDSRDSPMITYFSL